MKVTIFTQDDRVYLPIPIHTLVEQMPDKVACIILSPPMSTHGGKLKGLLRHLPVFGVIGTIRMGWQVIWARLGPMLGARPSNRDCWSIEEVGRKFGVPVHYVDDVNSQEMQQTIDAHPADLLVSVSCPQVLRPAVLSRFSKGGINVHSAPLPRYRGLMPAFWVLYNQEKQTAVTVHDLAEKLDNGDILLQRPVEISPGETWNSLLAKTKAAAGDALVDTIRAIESGTVERRPNLDEESTYFSFPELKHAREFRARGLKMF